MFIENIDDYLGSGKVLINGQLGFLRGPQDSYSGSDCKITLWNRKKIYFDTWEINSLFKCGNVLIMVSDIKPKGLSEYVNIIQLLN